MTTEPNPRRMANALRALSMDAVQAANSGHPGMPMGAADVATALFAHVLKFDAAAPDWPDRDRFVLSAGHGSMLLYALNHLLGYADMPIEEIKRFRQIGARTAGHPEFGMASGIETTTGPLGQGLANGVGLALAERLLNARFGADLVDHRTYVLAGDGCLMEGVSHEAIDLAGHLRLGRLTVLWDDNKISIDGSTDLATSMDQRKRFEAAGWASFAVDGHDHDAILAALAEAAADDRPALIACRTTIGFGAPTKAGTAGSHGAPLGVDEIAGAREALDWPYAPFEIPDDVAAAWAAVGARGAAAHADWTARKAAHAHGAAFDAALRGDFTGPVDEAIAAHKAKLIADKPKLATRVASQQALEALVPVTPTLIGGSADLTGSNNTKTKAMRPVTRDDFAGDYIHYGVREHAMAAAMNGLALHGGVIPYGGTFLVFTDYARPAIRLSALMGQRVVYVMTHDSIGLGEDGPTHQPIEHFAALRAIPGLAVFRPADAVETAEAWAAAIALSDRPSVLCLSRQGLPTLRADADAPNLTATGGYVLREADGARDVTLIATGSEVELAVAAADALAAEGIAAAVVSLPCLELFAEQDAAARAAILGAAPRIAIEAGVRQGWDRWIGEDGDFVGLSTFGASGPAGDLFKHFGLTAERVAETARAAVGRRKQAA